MREIRAYRGDQLSHHPMDIRTHDSYYPWTKKWGQVIAKLTRDFSQSAVCVKPLAALSSKGWDRASAKDFAGIQRSGPGTCPEFLSRGLGTLSRRRFSRSLAMSHRTAFSQEGAPGPRGRSVHPEDNARGRRLDPPASSSSVPLILRWIALHLPLRRRFDGPGALWEADGSWTARGEATWGLAQLHHTYLHNSVF